MSGRRRHSLEYLLRLDRRRSRLPWIYEVYHAARVALGTARNRPSGADSDEGGRWPWGDGSPEEEGAAAHDGGDDEYG